jgi:hypothetical protein
MLSSAGDATPLVDQVDAIEARNVGGQVSDAEAKVVSPSRNQHEVDAESAQRLNLRGNQAEPHQRVLGRFQGLIPTRVSFLHGRVDAGGEPSGAAGRGDDVPETVPDPVALGSVLVANQEDDGDAVREHADEALQSRHGQCLFLRWRMRGRVLTPRIPVTSLPISTLCTEPKR